jgi:methyltransferase (TIGR00027 family)
MQHGGSSLTALGAAAHRAAHQILDLPRIFEDELALPILGEEGEAMLRERLDEPARLSGLRALIAVRSRIARDRLGAAIERGVRQYVVLGAGLDTSAYRDPARRLRVFEVDHPATQSWKRARLDAAGIAGALMPSYVPVDFERKSLRAALEEASFSFGEPAFFAWLGVLPYLERSAIGETLHLIGKAPAEGMEIVFDYAEPPSTLSETRRSGFERMAHRVAAIGEPWRSFFAAAEMRAELEASGFREIEDLDAEALTQRYCGAREDGLAISPPARVVWARSGE